MLSESLGIVTSPKKFPELLDYVGEDLVVTDGTTLLGADDKAGIAEIVSAMAYLKQHPEVKHGKIRVGFNPDEEIGMGAHLFDVEKFGCDWAYTMDGGEVGELEFENFNAASAHVVVKGLNVHPGYAKNKMVNSGYIAADFVRNMLCWKLPNIRRATRDSFILLPCKAVWNRPSCLISFATTTANDLKSASNICYKWQRC